MDRSTGGGRAGCTDSGMVSGTDEEGISLLTGSGKQIMEKESRSDLKNIKYLAGILGLLVLLVVFWMWGSRASKTEISEETLTITAFSVGKADALLLQQGGKAVLVDAGEADDGDFLLKELKSRGIGQLDLLLITHFDKDHVGSASFLTENMDVATVMMPDYEGDRPEYAAFMESVADHPDVRRLTEPAQFTVGALEWTVYPAEDPAKIQDTEEEYDNDMSLVASVAYGNRKFLLTGDIEKTRIHQMLDTDVDWKHDWIKMPHHGRYQKALKELLDAVQPDAAVICCSEKNPAEEKTLELLEERQIPVWDTSEGSVVTVCDGVKMEVGYQ